MNRDFDNWCITEHCTDRTHRPVRRALERGLRGLTSVAKVFNSGWEGPSRYSGIM